jgi:nitrogen fixation NifU-like protein
MTGAADAPERDGDAPAALSANVEALYQDIILDHYRKPRNKGPLPGATSAAHIANPTCGDEVTVEAIVESGVIREVRFTGQGRCDGRVPRSSASFAASRSPATR